MIKVKVSKNKIDLLSTGGKSVWLKDVLRTIKDKNVVEFKEYEMKKPEKKKRNPNIFALYNTDIVKESHAVGYNQAIDDYEAWLKNKKKLTFEEYIDKQFWKQYTGLDDESVEALSDWLTDLSPDDWIYHAEKWEKL